MIFTVIFILFFTTISTNACSAKGADMKEQRRDMVKYQIHRRGVSDKRVLDAMLAVERHLFVPEGSQDLAYTDQPLPIGLGQTISQPYVVAAMTAALDLKPADKVLEIGTGSGYQAAILGELVQTVYTMEIVKPLADRARLLLDRLGYGNIFVLHGDGYKGWPEKAPFDAIIVTAAPPEVPSALIEQLKVGGRMVIPVGTGFQSLLLLTKTPSGLKQETLFPVRFVPMVPGNDSPQTF